MSRRSAQAAISDVVPTTTKLLGVLLVLLMCACVATGLAITQQAQTVRGLYQGLAENQAQQDALLAERSRLLLERGSAAQLQNIEAVAEAELEMSFPQEIAGVLQ